VQGENGECVIDLQLGVPGGGLTGRVVDGTGHGVAGATVSLRLPVGALKSPTASFRQDEFVVHHIRSSESGHFHADDLPVGTHAVAARAADVGRWIGELTLAAGRSATLDIELLPTAAVRGTVTDRSGAPVQGAFVGGPAGATWPDHRSTSSGQDGSYTLLGLPAGELDLVSGYSAYDVEDVRISVQLDPGAELVWDPVLDLGRRFDGRVVDALGRPTGRHRLEIATPGSGGRWPEAIDTDSEGRFLLVACPPGRYDVSVFAGDADETSWPLAVVRDVVCTGDECVVRLPVDTRRSAWVEARLLHPDGTPAVGVWAYLALAGQHIVTARLQPAAPDRASGRVRLGPLAPGDYQLFAWSQEPPSTCQGLLAVTGLLANETRDVGVMTLLDPGLLRVRLDLPEGVDAQAQVTLGMVHTDAARAGVFVRGKWTRAGDTWSTPLEPGDYRLQVSVEGVGVASASVAMAAGRDTELTLPVERGVSTRITFELPGAGHDPPDLAINVRDANGRLALEASTDHTMPEWKAVTDHMASSGMDVPSFPPGEDPAGRPRRRVLNWLFAPGSYTVSARFEGGAPVERAFEVPPSPGSTVRLDVVLH
jgi:hypothetical protein